MNQPTNEVFQNDLVIDGHDEHWIKDCHITKVHTIALCHAVRAAELRSSIYSARSSRFMNQGDFWLIPSLKHGKGSSFKRALRCAVLKDISKNSSVTSSKETQGFIPNIPASIDLVDRRLLVLRVLRLAIFTSVDDVNV
nr:hypothetical protein [Vibrio parahaemolyticus]